jgi:hypothetical protein
MEIYMNLSNQKITRRNARWLLGLMMALVMASVPLMEGCSGNTGTWQEEVKLLDGRVITVTQKRRYEGRVPREHWLTFKLQEFGDQDISWHENLRPQVLNVYQGKLYVVGMPFTGQEFRMYGNPDPSYLGYRYEAGEWQRIPFDEIPLAIYDTNLLIANAPPNGAKFVTFAIKAEEMKDETLIGPHTRINPKWKALNY